MPVKKRAMMSQKTSSVVVTTQVMESRTVTSSMTSLKTAAHKRSSSDKMIESWLSPSQALTSPQTWVSGPQAKFLSPPKSPSPKRRITRRSSVYVKPAWTDKSKLKSSPKGLEFKIPSGSITSLSSTRSRQSSVYQKSRGDSATSKRSPVYSKGGKGMSTSAILVKQEVHEGIVPRGKKSGKILSPKGKISKSPSPKKTKHLASVTRTRKRNVAELEKEDSPEKPATKRRKQAAYESIIESPKEGGKTSQKSITKQLEMSGSESSLTPSKAKRKKPKKAARLATKKATKSPSPQRSHTSPSPRRSRTAKSKSPSHLATKKVTKSPSPRRSGTAKSKFPTGLATKKATKSPSPRRSTSPSPQRSHTAKSKSPTGLATKKATKSPSPRRSGTAKSPSSVHQKKSLRSKQKTEDQEMEDTNDEDSTLEISVVSKSQKRKRKATHNTSVQSPVRKSAKSVDTPKRTPKQKSAKLSSKTESGGSLSSSKKAKSRKPLTQKSSTDEDQFSTPVSSFKLRLFEDGSSGKKTPTKKHKSGTPKSVGTPKSKSNSKEKSQKKSVSSAKKILQKRGSKTQESSEIISEMTISSSPEMSTPSKKKSKIPKQKSAATPKTPKQKIADTPVSEKKRSASSTKTRKGKSAAAKSPKRKSYTGTDMKGHVSTPRSEQKSKGKSQKSSTKKSTSPGLGRSAGRKAASKKLDASDSLDGFHLQVSSQQSKKKSSQTFSVSKKETKSKVDSVARSAEDEKILEILKKAVGSTPKSKIISSTPKSKKISTPKSAKSSKTSKIVSSTLKSKKISTPKSAKSSKKSATPRCEQNDKFATPKSQKSTKSATASGEARLFQKTSVSSLTKLTSPRTTLGLSFSKTPLSSRTVSSRQGLITSLSQSGKASASRIRSDDILSGDFRSLSIRGDYQRERSSRSAHALDRRSEIQLLVPRASLQGQSYQEEKQISQFVEYCGSSGTEKYGAHAAERTVGDQTYRAGCYRTERSKGLQMETEHEEGQWEEGDANNSAVSLSDDPNASVSTSTYSNRCTIL